MSIFVDVWRQGSAGAVGHLDINGPYGTVLKSTQEVGSRHLPLPLVCAVRTGKRKENVNMSNLPVFSCLWLTLRGEKES